MFPILKKVAGLFNSKSDASEDRPSNNVMAMNHGFGGDYPEAAIADDDEDFVSYVNKSPVPPQYRGVDKDNTTHFGIGS